MRKHSAVWLFVCISLIVFLFVLSSCSNITSFFMCSNGHTIEEVLAKDSTCSEHGLSHAWRCSVCDKYFEDEEGKIEISYSSLVIPAKGHTPVTDYAVEPTCIVEGRTEGSHCSVSKNILQSKICEAFNKPFLAEQMKEQEKLMNHQLF